MDFRFIDLFFCAKNGQKKSAFSKVNEPDKSQNINGLKEDILTEMKKGGNNFLKYKSAYSLIHCCGLLFCSYVIFI